VIAFRLEVKTKVPYPVSEAKDSEGKNSILILPGGGFASVPRRDWLKLPAEISGAGGAVGWIGFELLTRNDLTFAEATKMAAQLVAVQADGVEVRVDFPPYTPHISD
jgi:hypothetical protein